MRSIQTEHTFPLASVKPLEGLVSYRAHCIAATQQSLQRGRRSRIHSPVTGSRLEPVGRVEGLPYGRCPENGGWFLMELPDASSWADLLHEMSQYRHSPNAFHAGIVQSRAEHVYAPKLEWIRETLRLQGLERPRLLEVTTRPSALTPLLEESQLFATVTTVDEMALAHGARGRSDRGEVLPVLADVAVLLESIDRMDDPKALLRAIAEQLVDGGLIFLTALVASGFDLLTLGLRNMYLYPPDRANCFSLSGLSSLVAENGFNLLEVSTPGVLDVEIVRAHLQQDPDLPCSAFERQLAQADPETQAAFQLFLQQHRLSSFARLVGRKR